MPETRIVVVEDEPPARIKLRRLLADYPDCTIVGEAEDVVGGLHALREQRPDLLFLDVQLGNGSGFDLLTRLAPPYPLIVFSTAYHEYAVRAFEFAALDYLLKPYDRERFARAMTRVAERLIEHDEEGAEHRLRTLRAQLPEAPALRQLIVRERERSLVVPMTDVVRLSAAGNYVEVYTLQRRHLLRASLSRLAQRLDPALFLRVHRSHLVRADFVGELVPVAHGDCRLLLKDGSELMLSRRYKALLPESLRGQL